MPIISRSAAYQAKRIDLAQRRVNPLHMATEKTGPLRVVVAGASGTIGRAVVRELLDRGAVVTALLRPGTRATSSIPELAGAHCIAAAIDDLPSLKAACAAAQPDHLVSCIASRSGAPKNAHTVDYKGNMALMEAAQSAGARHFILLSAICVQKPLLAFQHAKLAFEARLIASGMDYTIVRPTAFFKSLSGQVKRVKAGKKFLIFGDGEITRCKPISDNDLARFIADCVTDPASRNTVLPIGGPGPAISLREQGELLFELVGKDAQFRSVSPRLFDRAEKLLALGERFSDWFAQKAEYARIARYYATESMLVLDPVTGAYSPDLTPEYGTDTLRDHYAALLAKG